jgi:hypothetical protein
MDMNPSQLLIFKNHKEFMKKYSDKVIVTLILLALSALNSQFSAAFAQGSAFTYQGELTTTNGPANGTYNFTFTLFNTNISGAAVAGPVTNNAVNVTNGLFTTIVDFGPEVFTGTSNWLEIAVETNGGSSFTNLSPRQQLTPVPYAIYAESTSNLLGPLAATQLPANVVTNMETGVTLDGVFSGTGTSLTTITTTAFLYNYSLLAQPSGPPGAWITATFGTAGPTDTSAIGWTYAAGTFTCNQAGLYLIEYDAVVGTAGAGSMSLRAFTTPPAAGAFIPGSQTSLNSGVFPPGTYVPVSKSFLAPFPVGATLNIQFASTVAGGVALVTPVGVAGATQPSISITIVRIF